MALENANSIEAPGLAMLPLPEQGNAVVDKSKSTGSEVIPGEGDLSDAEKLMAAEKILAEKEAAKNKDTKKDTSKVEKTEEQEESDKLTQAKLDELAKKEESTLTDEEKQFIEEHTVEDVDEITAVRQDLEATYGIKLENEYENSPEGLKMIVAEVAPKVGQQMLLGYLETIPHMRDFFDHMIEGKSIETFLAKNEKPVFDTIEIKPLTEVEEAQKPKMVDNLRTLLKMDLSNKGVDDETITSLTQLYEANGSLYDKAKAAKDSLHKTHQTQVDAKIKLEEQRIAAEQDAVQKEYVAVREMLTKNDVNGIQLPASDVKAFSDAMLRGLDAQGRTAMDTKREKLTLAQRTLIDYIVFKDFKISGLQAKTSAPARVFSFKKANEENNKRQGGRIRNGSSGGDGKTTVVSGHPNVDIKSFFIEKQTIN